MTTSIDVALAFAGIGLTGIGVVIVVPVFVRLLADLLHRFSPGPATLIAARRLQAQPAGVARVIAALMIGLFLVMGARCVVVAFGRTPQIRVRCPQHRRAATCGAPGERGLC